MNANEIIAALKIERAQSDTVRAQLLLAIDLYASEIGDNELMSAAQAAMPEANPFTAPDAWRTCYEEGFLSFADEDQGVYRDDMRRYCTEYWQSMRDDERKERLARPFLGVQDGEKDAQSLNDA